MKIQSVSILVTDKCTNNCKFCVSRMRKDDDKLLSMSLIHKDIIKRLEFTRDNGCNVLLYTGTGEPLLDKKQLERFARINRGLYNPFKWVEIQTSGIAEDGYLDDKNIIFLKETINVTTISLSISNIFDMVNNFEINRTPPKHQFVLEDVCRNIRVRNLNLRLSLNISDVYNNIPIDKIFEKAKELNANQITFRKLYTSSNNSKADKWVEKHDVREGFWIELEEYVRNNGERLETLPFGASKYSVSGMSIVIDDNCMSEKNPTDVYKFMILDNGKLYSRWGNKGSLIF